MAETTRAAIRWNPVPSKGAPERNSPFEFVDNYRSGGGRRRATSRAFGATAGAVAFAAAVALWAIPAASPARAQPADPSFDCLSEPGPLQVVDGFYVADKFEPPVEADKKFDARTAAFEYPETISHSMVSIGDKGGSGAEDMCWAGGFFTASTSWHDLDISWETSKQGYDDTETARGEMNNTVAVTSYENRMTWTGLHVYNMHDGIRTNNTYNDWTIQHVWMDYIRDDCIENDHIYSGTVYDSLFDGCYSGLSVRPSSTGLDNQLITMDRVLMRMEPMPYPYKWDTKDDPVVYVEGYGDVPFGHGSIFKVDEQTLPFFSITDSVFLQEYAADERIFPPADKVTACRNNTIVWLDGPASAPTHLLDEFPGCFTIITDPAEGREFWGAVVADWHARHPEVGLGRKPTDPTAYSWPRYPPTDAADGNDAPTAVIAASCVDLECTFDGSGSSDPDGTVERYDWDFGDSRQGRGETVVHAYNEDGTYAVGLTVADNAGAAGTTGLSVTVAAPAAPIGLSASGRKVKGRHVIDLSWSGADSAEIEIYRDGTLLATTVNDSAYSDATDNRGKGDYSYRVCTPATALCSDQARVIF